MNDAYKRLIKRLKKGKDINVILLEVNLFWNNNFEYQSDNDNYGLPDYWSSMQELLKNGKGDCEDFAIAKYFTLQELGIPASLAYCKLNNKMPHMVCICQGKVLDIPSVSCLIYSLDQRPDLKIVYQFTTENLWIKNRLYSIKDIVMSQWQKLLKRIKNTKVNK